ncbi:unnamed protein product [Sphagnum jensenii]|uniref:CobW C-terminal domain-containing protein n=1 Tax=Sphagnum jensenii TaxID=128206 RepID=A0ABP1AN07_9BRYO
MMEEEELPPLAVPISESSSESLKQPDEEESPVHASSGREEAEEDRRSWLFGSAAGLRDEEDTVGITMITGYLGAGKTTLVNFILHEHHGARIAVILNEFGDELGIEKAMVNDGAGGSLVEEWVELANGCVCCSVKHSFLQAIEQLLQRREKFDHILLETTGLANPGPVAAVLWVDDQLESPVRLDSIVTVVDARNIKQQLADTREAGSVNEAYLQIAFADVVVLNKVDLVPGELADVEAQIRKINALVKIVHSVRCQLNLKDILDRRSFDVQRSVDIEALLQLDGHNVHDRSVGTVSISATGAADLSKVDDWLGELLWETGKDVEVYRMKGVFHVYGSDKMHMLQAVRELYEILPSQPWQPEDKRVNRIVIIGKNLNRESLLASFRTCLVS